MPIKCETNLVGLNYLQRMHTYESILTEASFCISLTSIANHTIQKQNYAQRSSQNPPESNWCPVSKAGMSLMRSATNAWCSQSSRVKLHLVVLHQLRFIHTTLLLFTYSSCSMSLNIWRGIKCSINMIRCPLTLLFCHPSACNNSDQTLSKALALHLHRPSFFQQFLPRPRPRRIFSFLCWLVGFMNR